MSYVVRFGHVRLIGEFEAPSDLTVARGDQVVLRTDRGTELGEVLCEATPLARSQLVNAARGSIVRQAHDADLAEGERLAGVQRDGFATCLECIRLRGLQMKLIDVEAILGGERMVFYYVAENRVDFRELVKDLGRAFHTRIEMRQIGVRDEAKLMADYGDCGKPVCCNTHLTRMPPVSMRMAKLQKSTLDPAKISGRCGRLKCCLRYEFDTYQEMSAELPDPGARVQTARGQGRVEAVEILSQRVLVELDDHRRVLLEKSEIQAQLTAPRKRQSDPADDRDLGDETHR